MKRKHFVVSYDTFKGIPQNRDRYIQDTVEFGKSVEWHSDRFDRPVIYERYKSLDRPRKDLGLN